MNLERYWNSEKYWKIVDKFVETQVEKLKIECGIVGISQVDIIPRLERLEKRMGEAEKKIPNVALDRRWQAFLKIADGIYCEERGRLYSYAAERKRQ